MAPIALALRILPYGHTELCPALATSGFAGCNAADPARVPLKIGRRQFSTFSGHYGDVTGVHFGAVVPAQYGILLFTLKSSSLFNGAACPSQNMMRISDQVQPAYDRHRRLVQGLSTKITLEEELFRPSASLHYHPKLQTTWRQQQSSTRRINRNSKAPSSFVTSPLPELRTPISISLFSAASSRSSSTVCSFSSPAPPQLDSMERSRVVGC